MKGKREAAAKQEQTSEEVRWTFEEALAQLEQVVRDLEDGRLGLNESLIRYEDGVRILRFCQSALDEAERKILLLTSVDESGTAVTVPYDDQALSLEEKRVQRTRRRSSSSSQGSAGCDGAADSVDAADPTSEADQAGDMDRQKGLF